MSVCAGDRSGAVRANADHRTECDSFGVVGRSAAPVACVAQQSRLLLVLDEVREDSDDADTARTLAPHS